MMTTNERQQHAEARPLNPWANDHDRLDERRRQAHIAIANKIDADLSLLDVPRRNISRWTERMGHMPPGYEEWLSILDVRGLRSGTSSCRPARIRHD